MTNGSPVFRVEALDQSLFLRFRWSWSPNDFDYIQMPRQFYLGQYLVRLVDGSQILATLLSRSNHGLDWFMNNSASNPLLLKTFDSNQTQSDKLCLDVCHVFQLTVRKSLICFCVPSDIPLINNQTLISKNHSIILVSLRVKW